jgi:hypothetical protein
MKALRRIDDESDMNIMMQVGGVAISVPLSYLPQHL